MFRIYIYPIVVFLFILATLIPNNTILYLVGIFASFSIFISVFYARGIFLYSGLFFYVTGCIIFLINDIPINEYFLQFDTMLGILSLFLLLPFLTSLIHIGRYDKQLSNLMKYKINHLGDLYKRSVFTTYLLGLFLNIATIPLVIQSLHDSFKNFPKLFSDIFFTRALLRSYSLCLMWSPMEILIIQSISMTNQNYIIILPFLLCFSLLILFIDIYINFKKFKRYPTIGTTPSISFQSIMESVKDLFTLLFVLVLSVSILNYIIGKGYLFSLVLLIIPISLLWALKIRKLKRFLIHSISLFKTKTIGLANYFFMFLSAGFFVNMLSKTKFIQIIQNVFMNYHEHTFLLYTLIGGYFFIIAFLGFHPLVSIVLLAEILNPLLPIISSFPLTILLVITSLSAVLYSPFNLSTIILANEIERNTIRVGGWNILFAIFLISMAILFSYTLHIISSSI